MIRDFGLVGGDRGSIGHLILAADSSQARLIGAIASTLVDNDR